MLGSLNSGISPCKTDLHSHLIPGIDDGAKTVEDSIEMIRELQRLGFEKLVTTPHIMSHSYPNKSADILNGLQLLRRELECQGIDVVVEAAAEYYLDGHFLELLENGDLLTFGEQCVLIEMSYVNPLIALETIIFQIQAYGYRPVLAHPERYAYMHEDFEQYVRLKELDVLFQVNMNAFGGYYSQSVEKVATKLGERGMIDFVGSDIHSLRHVKVLEKVLKTRNFQTLLAKNTILNDRIL